MSLLILSQKPQVSHVSRQDFNRACKKQALDKKLLICLWEAQGHREKTRGVMGSETLRRNTGSVLNNYEICMQLRVMMADVNEPDWRRQCVGVLL